MVKPTAVRTIESETRKKEMCNCEKVQRTLLKRHSRVLQKHILLALSASCVIAVCKSAILNMSLSIQCMS